MLSAPVLDQIDARHTRLEAKLDAQKSEINRLRWTIVMGTAGIFGMLVVLIVLVA